jgi:ferritin-like metal-binding protein YciE
MAELARSAELKEVITKHLEETRPHTQRMGEVLRHHEANPREHLDQAMQALVRESEKWAGMLGTRCSRTPG